MIHYLSQKLNCNLFWFSVLFAKRKDLTNFFFHKDFWEKEEKISEERNFSFYWKKKKSSRPISVENCLFRVVLWIFVFLLYFTILYIGKNYIINKEYWKIFIPDQLTANFSKYIFLKIIKELLLFFIFLFSFSSISPS